MIGQHRVGDAFMVVAGSLHGSTPPSASDTYKRLYGLKEIDDAEIRIDRSR